MEPINHACAACGEGESEVVCRGVFGSGAGEWRYTLTRCSSCGMGRLSPLPSAETLTSLYSPEYEAYRYVEPEQVVVHGLRRKVKMAVAHLAAQRHLDTRPRFLGAAGRLLADAAETMGGRTVPLTTSYPLSLPRRAARILDYGTGAGWWLRVMRTAGYRDLYAYDLASAGLDALAADGITVLPPAGSLPRVAFDCIRMEHVLEHIADPSACLKELAAALRPGGSIVLAVPNFDSWSARALGEHWGGLGLPHHLYHFTERSLRLLGARVGLKVAEVRKQPIWECALPAAKAVPRERWPQGLPAPRNGQWRLRYHRWARARGEGDFLGMRLCLDHE
jgi:2-polyprenyl-3-methyl-5-hydroxy-6-metoxy-1,4-benzoquinol methylase